MLEAWSGIEAYEVGRSPSEAKPEFELSLELAWELVAGVCALVVLDDHDALLGLDLVCEVWTVARALLWIRLGVLAVPARDVVRQLALVEPFVQTCFEFDLRTA